MFHLMAFRVECDSGTDMVKGGLWEEGGYWAESEYSNGVFIVGAIFRKCS